jgi:hypothetical protein
MSGTVRFQPARVIYLHTTAPAKPARGEPCNGCGVCCATEPCPVGVLISRRRQGACDALRWSDGGAQYRCALVADARSLWPWLPRWASGAVGRLARRWISAASGCDATLELDVPSGA